MGFWYKDQIYLFIIIYFSLESHSKIGSEIRKQKLDGNEHL